MLSTLTKINPFGHAVEPRLKNFLLKTKREKSKAAKNTSYVSSGILFAGKIMVILRL